MLDRKNRIYHQQNYLKIIFKSWKILFCHLLASPHSIHISLILITFDNRILTCKLGISFMFFPSTTTHTLLTNFLALLTRNTMGKFNKGDFHDSMKIFTYVCSCNTGRCTIRVKGQWWGQSLKNFLLSFFFVAKIMIWRTPWKFLWKRKKKKGALAFVRRFDSKRFFFSKGGVRLGHHN